MAEKPDYVLTGVRVVSRDEVYVSSSIRQLVEERVDHAVLHRYTPEGRKGLSLIWSTAGMTPLPGEGGGLLWVSIDGEVLEIPRDQSEHIEASQGEQVDTSEDGPSTLVHLRTVQRIGSSVYCAGFARRVYRRDQERQWSAVDKGTFVARRQRKRPIGFFALGGRDETLFYAAGLGGEIWSCNQGAWTQESSPTNLALHTMAVLPTGQICIAGMSGVVLTGSAGRWKVIEQDLTEEPFWGSTLFQGRVYLANDDGVFVLNDALDDLELVLENGEKTRRTSYLDARDGVMWSVGDKAIARTEDGTQWVDVAPP